MHDQIWFQEYRKISLLCNHQDTIVYLAEHVKLLDKYVIKQVKKNSISYQQAIMEAKLLQSLQHPCIPTLYDTFESHDFLFLVEQYMEGESLQSICQSEQLSVSTILSFSIQLCNVISYLHSLPNPVLHLDLNPNNIIVMKSRIAVIDFSASLRKADITGNISRYGTVGYAAPEQFNNKKVDERTDLYGIGSTIAYMLDQVIPSEIKVHSREVSELQHIISRCRRQRKIQRYSRVQQVGSLLSQICKRQGGYKKEKELFIAVAGAQSHIGVTHTSLLLCSYLKHHGIECLYAELNSSKSVKYMIAKQKSLNENAVYEYEHIPMLPSMSFDSLKRYQKDFRVIIADYGTLSEENRDEFESSDLRFFVYGGKAYEWPKAEKCIQGLTTLSDTYFLKNFQTAKESKKMSEMIPRKQSFILPYEPDIRKIASKKLNEFFAQLKQLYF
ncbi:MAG: serine/threonine-protein kinase [Clostridiales bacterium]|nr:serine/threonine-protein kinase [Clostridiales bacterium]